MDKDFEELLNRMHAQRQFEAVILGTAIFLAGLGLGIGLTAWLAGIL